jgi:hypothetical protein
LLQAATLVPQSNHSPDADQPGQVPTGPAVQLADQRPYSGGAPRDSEPSADVGGWVVLFLFGAGVFAMICVAVARSAGAKAARVRIVAVPPGEAPEQVRRAWVGLELPLTRGESGPRAQDVVGVQSNRLQGQWTGFAVNGATAVTLLAAKAPEAAGWWRRNAPHVLVGGYTLVFPAEVCERVG